MKVSDVKTHIVNEMKLQGVKNKDLIVANQRHGKISQFFDDKDKVFDIDQDREYTMVYHVPNQTEETEIVEFNFHKHQKRGKNSYTTDLIEKSAPRLHALSRETSLMDIKRLVYQKMRGIFDKEPEGDEELNSIIEVHISDNLPMVKTGIYTKSKAKCEFYGKKHSYR